MSPYISNVADTAAGVGIGRTGKIARSDIKAAGEGRIEDMVRLRPVLSAIRANTAASYKTGERALSKTFGLDPALQAGNLAELSGRLDENAGLAFSKAASGAYSDAEAELDRRSNFADTMHLTGAEDAARLYQSSFYDAARKGGLLQDILRASLMFGVAGGQKALGSAVGSSAAALPAGAG